MAAMIRKMSRNSKENSSGGKELPKKHIELRHSDPGKRIGCCGRWRVFWLQGSCVAAPVKWRQKGIAASCTMNFGSVVEGNIYAVGLRRELAGAKVYTVKH